MSTLEYTQAVPQHVEENEFNTKKFLIQGINQRGETFRPSDWAERVSGGLCTFENKRIQYSPLLHPAIHNGQKCVRLDPKLKTTNPDLYQTIVQFVEENELQVCAEEDMVDSFVS